jgi:hypothetical protein
VNEMTLGDRFGGTGRSKHTQKKQGDPFHDGLMGCVEKTGFVRHGGAITG